MLIKPKTTGENLHQTVTLVVSGATVRFIYGEACACRHACPSVYLCGRQMKIWPRAPVQRTRRLNVCHTRGRHHDACVFLSDCLTSAVISAHLGQSLNSFPL